jgi:hypothetical protein
MKRGCGPFVMLNEVKHLGRDLKVCLTAVRTFYPLARSFAAAQDDNSANVSRFMCFPICLAG